MFSRNECRNREYVIGRLFSGTETSFMETISLHLSAGGRERARNCDLWRSAGLIGFVNDWIRLVDPEVGGSVTVDHSI